MKDKIEFFITGMGIGIRAKTNLKDSEITELFTGVAIPLDDLVAFKENEKKNPSVMYLECRYCYLVGLLALFNHACYYVLYFEVVEEPNARNEYLKDKQEMGNSIDSIVNKMVSPRQKQRS